MEGLRLRCAALQVTFGARIHEFLTQRAQRFIAGRWPVQAVLLSRRADELVGVVLQGILADVSQVELLLCIDVGQASLDGAQLVFAYAPIDDLLGPRCAVPVPVAFARGERDRKWELVLAYLERDLVRFALVERVACL